MTSYVTPLMMSEGGPTPSQAPFMGGGHPPTRTPACECHWGYWGGLGGHWEALGCTGKHWKGSGIYWDGALGHTGNHCGALDHTGSPGEGTGLYWDSLGGTGPNW